jgi:nuclease S1
MRIRFRHALLAALLWPALALAWGPEGHRIVGELAQRQLDPQARAAVAELLRGEPEPTLAGVANWADELRDADPDQYRRTSRWHYVNFRSDDCSYVPARDCRGGDCVIAAINDQLRMLGDRTQPRASRVQALKFVVHFIGDVHQPFHAGGRDDRGGNDFQISYHGQGSNLHAVWDTLILQGQAPSPAAYAARLATTPVAPAAIRIDPEAAQRWAQESCHAIDADALYPPTHTINDAYLNAHRALAEQRLRLAGARLAAELNATLAIPTQH